MKITFLGGTHEVTGSCYLIEACGKNIVVDCGMEQGPDVFENEELPLSPAVVDAAFLTHAHIDHSGRLPLLYARGFRGPIYATKATSDLCNIMLRDSAHIQEFEAEWRNRKAKRSGREPYVPMYTMDDAVNTVRLFRPCEYRKEIKIFDGITIRFIDAGHLLGSSSIEVWLTEDGITRKLVFSGDIGNNDQPILREPQYIAEADYVIMESTYGIREHGLRPDYVGSFTEIIRRTFDRGGNVVVPSFAVGRTQEMLYFLRQIKAEGLVKGHEGFSVYVDSPLANEATRIFTELMDCCYDDETRALIEQGINPIGFDGLKTSITSDESKEINFDAKPKVIISASGMCEAGRIKHHLKHNLWRPESTIVFVGYQAKGTLGRSISEGAEAVKIFGESIEIKAEIARLAGISSHADANGLIKWAKNFNPTPKRFFVVHGEDTTCEAFKGRLIAELGAEADAPYSGDAWDLITGERVTSGTRKRIEKPSAEVAGKTVSHVFVRLLDAMKRLEGVVEKNEGSANKDLARFTDQINALSDKWDR